MKNIIKIFIVIFVVGCSSGYNKQQYLKEFQTFIVETEKQYLSYEPEKWIEVTSKFRKFAVNDYNTFKSELSEKEIVLIDKLKGQFYSFATKALSIQVKSKSTSLYNQIEALIDELSK